MLKAEFIVAQKEWEEYAKLISSRKDEDSEYYLMSRLGFLPKEWGYIPMASFRAKSPNLVKGKVIGRDGIELLSQRIVFPVRDESGLLRGLVGRLLSIEEDPRTRYVRVTIPHWRWGGLIYGWHNIDIARKSVVLVEGVMDEEALIGQGIPSLAYITRSLSDRQCAVIARYFKHVVLLPDNEVETKEQIKFSVTKLRSVGVEVTEMYTPGSKDASEWVEKGCPGSLKRKLLSLTC